MTMEDLMIKYRIGLSRIILFSFILFIIFPFTAVYGQENNVFEWYKTLDNHELYDIAYGNDMFAAVGSDGIIKVSEDGSNWLIADSKKTLLKSIVWGDSGFVAAGALGKVYVSEDGLQWDEVTTGTEYDLNSVSWNGKVYTAAGEKGTVIVSENGKSWTAAALDKEYSINKLVSGEGKFIATISDTFNLILVSDNGTEWKEVEPFENLYGYYNAAFNGENFIMWGKVPNENRYEVLISGDGENWTRVEGAPDARSITTDGHKFVAAGSSEMREGILTQNIFLSEDGTVWETREIKWSNNYFDDLRFIDYLNGKFCGIKYNGAVTTSDDGLNWEEESSNFKYDYNKLILIDNMMVSYADNGNMIVSADGSEWIELPIGIEAENPIHKLYADDNILIAIAGSEPKLYYTLDGINWDVDEIDGLDKYSRIIFVNDEVLVIAGNNIYKLTDEYSWEKLGLTYDGIMVRDIAYDGNKYVSVGGLGIIYGGEGNHSEQYRITASSSDLENWDIERTEGISSLNSVVWAQDKFTAAGDNGTILISSDGQNWAEASSPTTVNLNDIIWNGSYYLACGEKGTILYSQDGISWNISETDTTDDLIEIYSSGDSYFAVGTNTILTGINIQLPESKFTDIKGHWAENFINEAYSLNIVNGIDDYHFSPDRSITRAEFAAIVVRALNLESTDVNQMFSDVTADQWFYDEISAAYENGLIDGYGEGIFKPNNPISREEAMAVMERALKYYDIDTNMSETDIAEILSGFNDFGEVSNWAAKSAAVCISNDIFEGSGGYLRPTDSITRAETAKIILKLLESI
jgi:hypothetical protein